MEDILVLTVEGCFRRKLHIGTMNIRSLQGETEEFNIRWTQLERIEMDRKFPFKILRFICFDRTETVSTIHFSKKNLKEAYYHLVDISTEYGIKVMEVNGW